MTEALLNKPYWVIDFLPEQVPEGSSGQYFAVEEYFLRPERIAAIHTRFADILLKLNCYYDLQVCEAGTEAFETNPAPEALFSRVCEMKEDLWILLPGENALLTLNRDYTHMTVYHPDKTLLRRLDRLAASAGLFLWQPETGAYWKK